MKRVNFRLFALAIALVATSCVKDVVVDSNFHGTPSEKICFGAELKDTGEDTRGGVVSNRVGKHDLKSADGEFVLPIGVYVEDGIGCADAAETRGALFTNAGEIDDFTVWAKHEVDNKVSAYFNEVVYTKNTEDNIFYSPTGEEYMWPGDGELTFVALTNAPESGFEPNCTADSEDILESFTYTVPTDATAQNDIVLAKATYDGGYEASAPLKFEHIMSAVNVKIGSVVEGEIRSITFKNVYNKGNYLVDQGVWVVDKTSVGDFIVMMENGKFVSTGNDASGTLVNNVKDATFMMIPQNPGENAEMVIEFYDSKTGHTYADGDSDTEHNALRGSISGDNWDKAKTTNYMLSIDESFTLTIEPVGKKLDAHYVIGYANVTVEGIDNWTITAETLDGSEVTIQPEEEVNPLAKQGFWTDKVVDDKGNITTESARGDSSWSGSGNVTNKLFYIFIPENITGSDREIRLTLRGTGASTATSTKVILQKYPNWTAGGFGWEVVDDAEKGKYGFKWTRKVAYIYPYGQARIFDSHVEDYCKNFINNYGAGANNFATVVVYNHDWKSDRAYILLDYSKLNNVTGADSATEGYDNTLALYRQAGTTAASQFETILTTIKKTESGKETENMFRLPTDSEVSSGKVPAESGQANDLSAIMEYIQKKNMYYLQKNVVKDSEGNDIVVYVPYFYESDLKWYLPAYGQFDYFNPDPNIANDAAANYWSSTTAGTTTAWTGGKEEKDRDLEYRVIAVRKDENGYGNVTVSEISTEEMKGGDNGEAQWVE